MGCRTACEGDMARPPETSEGCEALGNRSEGQSLVLRRCSGTAPRSTAGRAEPRLPRLLTLRGAAGSLGSCGAGRKRK